jgi:futalosine hydrolase
MRNRRHGQPVVHRVLVVTAVQAEQVAVLRGVGSDAGAGAVHVIVGGVGVAAADAAATRALVTAEHLDTPFTVVVCAGIAGGFAGKAGIGATVLATRSVAADLGAETPDGFIGLDQLGFGASTVEADAGVRAALHRALPHAVLGEILTVTTVTGSHSRASDLLRRYPRAVAEAMEGFGVASAAAQSGVGFAELRTISNAVGLRDTASWRIAEALAALEQAAGALASLGP